MQRRERRRYGRFPVIHAMQEEVLMYLSPPLIQDPVPVIINELSAGGMSLETSVALPTRFLFTIVFAPPGMKKIYAEGKAVHVLKKTNGYNVGIKFTKIDPAVVEKINTVALDVASCGDRIAQEIEPVCRHDCQYRHLCKKKEKTA